MRQKEIAARKELGLTRIEKRLKIHSAAILFPAQLRFWGTDFENGRRV